MLGIAFLSAARVNAIRGWLFRGGWKILLGLLLIALSAFMAWRYTDARRDAKAAQIAAVAAVERAETIDRVRSADDRATGSAAAAKAVIVREEAVKLDQLNTALRGHEDWANEPIPAEVLQSLAD